MSQAPIALVPLDERPVNVGLPSDVAAIAGVQLCLPPDRVLPHFRTPTDTDALRAWLFSEATAEAEDLIVCLDTVVYGGLIPARISNETTGESLRRLECLAELHQQHPEVSISAVGLVMRASDSYSAVEEPEYWSSYGRDLHALGGRVHQLLSEPHVSAVKELSDVPELVITDFERRRLRNHMVNLATLELQSRGVFDTLAITADDTAASSAGSAEQMWLRHWMRLLPTADRTLMYPGADEVGATLVARVLTRRAGEPVRVRVECADAAGLDRVPPFENQPLRVSLARQLSVVGARHVDGGEDAVLVIHGPDPAHHDMFAGPPLIADRRAAEATASLIAAEVQAGRRVALADLRHPNGADAELGRILDHRGLLFRLEAYAAWNTSGNALGSVLALTVAAALGRRSDTLDEQARRIALARRILDDYGYQADVRWRRAIQLFGGTIEPVNPEVARAAETVIGEDLRERLRGWGVDDIELTDVRLPWDRSFEVDLQLRGRQP